MTPISTPDPDDAAALVAEAEAFLADHAPATTTTATAQAVQAVNVTGPAPAGDTRRVRKLRAEVTESHQLADLQDDDTPFLVDSAKVRRRRKAGRQAKRLHELDQDPDMRAWQAARMRRLLVAAAMVSLALALGWSTAGVQAFAAEHADTYSPQWWFAWCVEPFMSLALLTVVGAKAYMGTRGQPIESKTLTRIEWLFLALTLGMNAWPHLPKVADHFKLSALVLHVLGPVVAVAIVTAVPVILAAFAGLNHDTRPTLGDLAQIGRDQGEHESEPGSEPGLKMGPVARREKAAADRQRVAEYMATHPDASISQTATALGMSAATVKRHRLAIRQEGQ
jgi:hypothetical protein